MKYLKIILLSSLSLIALLLLAVFAYFLLYIFCVFKAELPDSKTEEVYYYLPEVELYVKLESTTVRISRHLCTLTSQHVHSTDLQVMSKQYPSTIYYPFEHNREQRVFIRDPHNCLSVIRNTGSVVWISEKNTVFEIPQSVEIDLPIYATDIHYRLPDGADRKAIPIDKENIDKERIDSESHGWGPTPLDLLPEQRQTGTIEDACFNEVDRYGMATLQIRSNWIVCGKHTAYPVFYYNPQYPNFLFCYTSSGRVMYKKCEDIQLIECLITREDIQRSGFKNWYQIQLKPLRIEEIN